MGKKTTSTKNLGIYSSLDDAIHHIINSEKKRKGNKK